MKTKNLFLLTCLILFGTAIESNGQVMTNFVTSFGNTAGTSGYSVYVGSQAGLNTIPFNSSDITGTSFFNTYVGHQAGTGTVSNSSGRNNAFLGSASGYNNNTGSENLFAGALSGYRNTTGNYNVFLGYNSGCGSINPVIPITGSMNTFIGWQSGKLISSGERNTFIGHMAGNNITTGSNNTFLGNVVNTASSTINNTIILADGSSNQRLYIHSDGNTGIGLGNNGIPQNKLEVKSGIANASGLRLTNLTNASTVTANPGGKVLSVSASGDVILVTDQLGSGGAVTNDLASSVNTMTSTVNGIADTAPIVNSVVNTITTGQLTTTVNGVASAPILLPSSTEVDGSVTNELQTLTENPVQTTGTAITLSNGGGTVYVDGSETKIQAGTNVTVTGAGTSVSPYVINSTATSGSEDINIYKDNGTITPANGVRTVTMNNNNLVFNTTGSTNNGRIYIGSNPNFPVNSGNYRLNVEGGILTEKVKVALRSTANWMDHVFADDYKLMPLNKVETFVKTNKHLPGISSAENLVNEGLDLGEMQAKQMGKIEELTLYVIEQNKQIEKQSKEIEELKVLVNALVNKNK